MTRPNKTSYEKTEQNTVRRVPKRADYDVETVHRIFDQAWFCHVGFISETGPAIIPMVHARLDDQIILHGATTSRLMRLLASGAPISLSVAMVDGLVHEADYQLNVWAGVVPLQEQMLMPVADPLSPREIAVPKYIDEFRRVRNGDVVP